MSAASVVLIAAALLFTCTWAGLLWRLWVVRHSFKIAARAPVLIGICGWSTLAVLSSIFLHWILLLNGNGLPCFVMFLVSYLWIAAGLMPYCLRACRLVILYNTQYRLKYARFVKHRNIAKISAVMGTGVVIGAFLVLHNMPARYARDHYGCFFFNERRAIELTLFLGVGPTAFIMFKLMKGHDVFGIGPEIVRVIVPIMIGGVIKSTVQELLSAGVLESSRAVHLFMELVIVVCFSNLLCWSVLVPVSDYYGWGKTEKGYVVPLEEPASASVRVNQGVLDYAQEGGEVAEIFGEFCRQSLCMESWDFIMASMEYKKLTNPQEQFDEFMAIVDRYLRPRSPQEINLGSKMQDQILQFQTSPSFTNLREDTRMAILDVPVREIVLVLEQNLLAKFKLTPAMRRLERKTHRSVEHDAGSGIKNNLVTVRSYSTEKMASSSKTFLTL